jgi:hypothetical protein
MLGQVMSAYFRFCLDMSGKIILHVSTLYDMSD